MNQLKLLQDQENITKIADNEIDRTIVNDLDDLATGQLVFLDQFKNKLGFKRKGRVVDVHGREVNYAYWPREQDLEKIEIYQSARDKFKNKNFDEMNRKEKKVFMVNAKTTTLAEMDYINQQQGRDIFSLPPEARRKVKEYISNFLPVDQYYSIAFGEVKEYLYKIGDKMIAKAWNTIYIGELTSRVEVSKAVIDYDCIYELRSGNWKRKKDNGQIEILNNYIESYSMDKLKLLTEKGTPVSY